MGGIVLGGFLFSFVLLAFWHELHRAETRLVYEEVAVRRRINEPSE